MLTSSYPCDGCEDRAVGCHAACERYAEARAARDARREADHKRLDSEAASRDLLQDGFKRTVRRYGRK